MKYVWEGYQLIAELDVDNEVIRQYYYEEDVNGDGGVGKLLGFTEGDDYYTVISDNVGNVTAVLNEQGEVVNRYVYSPFGELLEEEEGVELPIGFNTKIEDETGLVYYNNRYYSKQLG